MISIASKEGRRREWWPDCVRGCEALVVLRVDVIVVKSEDGGGVEQWAPQAADTRTRYKARFKEQLKFLCESRQRKNRTCPRPVVHDLGALHGKVRREDGVDVKRWAPHAVDTRPRYKARFKELLKFLCESRRRENRTLPRPVVHDLGALHDKPAPGSRRALV